MENRAINKKIKVFLSFVIVLFIILCVLIVAILRSKSKNNSERGTEESVETELYQPKEKNIVVDEENSGIGYVNNMVIIVFNDDAEKSEINHVIDSIDGRVVGRIESIKQYQVEIGEHSLDELSAIVDEVEKNESVMFAHYDQVYKDLECSITPDDPWDGNVTKEDWTNDNMDKANWWLKAIEAPAAWEYNDRFSEIKIGIVDNGFDTDHKDLKLRFSGGNEILNSKENHGTHVAGIIGAKHNNIGISGIVQKADLVCFDMMATEEQRKVHPNWAHDNMVTDNMVIAGLIYEVKAGCKVINFSLTSAGDYDFDNKKPKKKEKEKSQGPYEESEIDKQGRRFSGYISKLLQEKNDFIVVQCAGNAGIEAKHALLFAAINEQNCYDEGTGAGSKQEILDRVVVVAATEKSDTGYMLTEYSGYGTTADIAAPGGSGRKTVNPTNAIYSSITENRYDSKIGTSMAAPMVTGVLSLVWSVDESFTGAEVVDIVLNNTNITVEDNNVVPRGISNLRMVNARLAVERALQISDYRKYEKEQMSQNHYDIGSKEFWTEFMESNQYEKYFASELNPSELTYYIEDFNSDGKYELIIGLGGYDTDTFGGMYCIDEENNIMKVDTQKLSYQEFDCSKTTKMIRTKIYNAPMIRYGFYRFDGANWTLAFTSSLDGTNVLDADGGEDYLNVDIGEYMSAADDLEPIRFNVNQNKYQAREMNYYFRSAIESSNSNDLKTSKPDFDECIKRESLNIYEIKRNMENGRVEIDCKLRVINSQLENYFSNNLTEYTQAPFCRLALNNSTFTVTIRRQKNGTYIIDTDVQSRNDLGTQEYWTAFINSKQYQEYIVEKDTFWGQQWTKDQDNTQKYVVYDFNNDGQNELLVEYMGCNHMFFYIREDGGIDAVQISPYYTQDLKIDKNTNLVMMAGAYQGRGGDFFAYYEFDGQEFHLVFTTRPNGDCHIEEGVPYSKEQAMKIENNLSDFDWIKIP